MNNDQFRKLLLAKSAKSSGPENNGLSPSSGATSGTRSTLGSRLKSSIPMTPRSVTGRPDFARQLAERNQDDKPNQQKKFRSSAPKGSRLAEGYVDRVRTRHDDEDDERAQKLKRLEESLKNEEIDQETFDKLQSEIAGGDLDSTHLVKGLDFRLLKRIREGENVYDENPKSPDDEPGDAEEEPALDVDDELDRLEATEVQVAGKERPQKKKGQLATTNLYPGQKRSRNQILAELKASRSAAKAQEESSLGSKFKKIGAKKTPGTRIERDGKGREVMIIVDEDGHERRKVRKIDTQEEREKERLAFVPDKNAEVLGMEVPEYYKKQQIEKELEEEDKLPTMFDDIESDYDPLAGLEGGSDEDSSSDGDADTENVEGDANDPTKTQQAPQIPSAPLGPQSYFKDSKTGLTSEETYKAPSMDDPAFLAALQKARALGDREKSEEEQKAAERDARLKKLLQSSNRDDDDLDMGFGTNRMEDEADFDDSKVKLSAWSGGAGADGDEADGREGGEKSKRKRGGKKRKGDKDSFADVMSVMQRNRDKAQ